MGIGAPNAVSDTPIRAAARMKQSPRYLMGFNFLPSAALAFTDTLDTLKSLSDTSMDVPKGQTMEQKNLPKMIVRPIITAPGRSVAMKPLVIKMVVTTTSGPILRKRSTGIGSRNGKAAYHSS